MRLHKYLLAGGLALFVVAPALQAQAAHEHQPIPAEQIAKADDLYRQAEALMSTCQKAQWEEAAALFIESARLRECHDPKIYSGLREAAELVHYIGDTSRAHQLMKEAAEHAMHLGEVEFAVEAYVKAVYMAAELGDRDMAVSYRAWAEDLSHSPYLGDRGRELQKLIAMHFVKN